MNDKIQKTTMVFIMNYWIKVIPEVKEKWWEGRIRTSRKSRLRNGDGPSEGTENSFSI